MLKSSAFLLAVVFTLLGADKPIKETTKVSLGTPVTDPTNPNCIVHREVEVNGPTQGPSRFIITSATECEVSFVLPIKNIGNRPFDSNVSYPPLAGGWLGRHLPTEGSTQFLIFTSPNMPTGERFLFRVYIKTTDAEEESEISFYISYQVHPEEFPSDTDPAVEAPASTAFCLPK